MKSPGVSYDLIGKYHLIGIGYTMCHFYGTIKYNGVCKDFNWGKFFNFHG